MRLEFGSTGWHIVDTRSSQGALAVFRRNSAYSSGDFPGLWPFGILIGIPIVNCDKHAKSQTTAQ